MKKIFLFFVCLIFIICLAGCGEKEDKINIEFIIDGKSHLIEIDKGTSISKDIIPLSNEEEVVELYYDENMEKEYDDEIINDDLIIYVKKLSGEIIINFQLNLIEYINVSVNPQSAHSGIISGKEKIEEIIFKFNDICCEKVDLIELQNLEKEEGVFIINIFYFNVVLSIAYFFSNLCIPDKPVQESVFHLKI